MINAEEQEQRGQSGKGDGPGERDVAGADFQGGCRGGTQLGVQLNHSHCRLIPILVVENEACALRNGKAFVIAAAKAEADLGAERDDDFAARRFGKMEGNEADVASEVAVGFGLAEMFAQESRQM